MGIVFKHSFIYLFSFYSSHWKSNGFIFIYFFEMNCARYAFLRSGFGHLSHFKLAVNTKLIHIKTSLTRKSQVKPPPLFKKKKLKDNLKSYSP